MMIIEKKESFNNSYHKPKDIPSPQSCKETAFQSNIPQVQNSKTSGKNKEEQIDIKSVVKKYYIPISENFEIMDTIGTGSESIVNKVIHKKSKKEFALKYIKNKEQKRNVNELKIANKLKNENIIRFLSYSCSKEDKSEVILMESAKFGNLRNFQLKSLKRSVLSESLLCYFANEILKGLLFCHRNKVAHMDLKPQNVVIDDYLHAKLIDFSISVNYSDKNLNDKIKLSFKGTKFYMPLEIINSKTIEYKDINKVDAYALGVMLYNLAFGNYPYDIKYEDDYDTINEKIKNNKLEIKNENTYSKHFINFIEKLLHKDINERMSIYEALNHYWIKGGQILYDEKEKIFNIYSFTTQLITDNLKEFNDYLLI